MKTCKQCKAEKQFTEFSKKAKAKDGLQFNCKSCTAEYHAAWSIANREKRSAQMAKYRIANREKLAAYQSEYHAANPGNRAAQHAAWRAANPDKHAESRRNRRAMKRSAEGKHTSADVRAIFEAQRGLCANCKTKLFKSGKQKFHVDHVMPLKLGGSNWPANLQCLCPSCNTSKGAKHPIDWAADHGRLL